MLYVEIYEVFFFSSKDENEFMWLRISQFLLIKWWEKTENELKETFDI